MPVKTPMLSRSPFSFYFSDINPIYENKVLLTHPAILYPIYFFMQQERSKNFAGSFLFDG